MGKNPSIRPSNQTSVNKLNILKGTKVRSHCSNFTFPYISLQSSPGISVLLCDCSGNDSFCLLFVCVFLSFVVVCAVNVGLWTSREWAAGFGQSLLWEWVCFAVWVSILQARCIHRRRMALLWLPVVRMLCVHFVVFPSSSVVSWVCVKETKREKTEDFYLICKISSLPRILASIHSLLLHPLYYFVIKLSKFHFFKTNLAQMT